jgi:hypothetical protein
VVRSRGRATLSNVADLARGLGAARYSKVSSGGNSKKRKAEPDKETMDISAVAGGKVDMKKEVRSMPAHMLMSRTQSR